MSNDRITIICDSVPTLRALERFFTYLSKYDVVTIRHSFPGNDTSQNIEQKSIVTMPPKETNQYVIFESDFNVRKLKFIVKYSKLIILAYDQPIRFLKMIYRIRCRIRFKGPCLVLIPDTEDIRVKYISALNKSYIRLSNRLIGYSEINKLKNLLGKNGEVNLPKMSYVRFRRVQRKIGWLYRPSKSHGLDLRTDRNY